MVSLRSWATPLIISSFLLMSATGILMFFHWDEGIMTGVHQWFSWLFLVGGAAHIVVNIRPLKAHLRSFLGKTSLAASLIILAASFFPWGLTTGPQLLKPVERALVDAPLYMLADLTRTAPDTLVQRLLAHGITATSQQSVQELSGGSGFSAHRLLAIVFLPE